MTTDQSLAAHAAFVLQRVKSMRPSGYVLVLLLASAGCSGEAIRILTDVVPDGGAANPGAGQGSDGGPDGGGSSAGFIAEPGFTVTATAFEHGQAMTITRSQGTWRPRTYSEYPWLYDTGEQQFVAGTVLDAMAGVGDGQLVPVNIAQGPWGGYGSAAHRISLARGSREAPNPRTSAWWYSTTGAANMKTVLGDPVWPANWNGGVQNNRRLYVSWWFRMKSAYQSGEPFRGKYLRYNATDGSGIGAHQFNPDTLQHEGGAMYGMGPTSLSSTWYRLELFIDLDEGAVDAYVRYRYCRQVDATGTTKGPHEFRRNDNYLYTLSPTGNIPLVNSWSNVTVGSMGYDGQSGDVHGGQEHDIANVYVDTEWERFELSASSTWDIGPNTYGVDASGSARELQGRWRRVSGTEAQVYVNQGQFTSLSGKYLWYVDGLKTATLIGRFE